MASPNYRHGKYSRDLPSRYAADYQAALSDPDIHALSHEIGIIEARYRALLRRSETSDLGHAWLMLQTVWDAYRDATEPEEVLKARHAVEKIIRRGAQDYLLWQSLQETTKLLSTLRYQEHKRVLDLRTVMTEQQMEQALRFIETALYEAVMAHVDKELGRRILADTQARLRRLLPHRALQGEPGKRE